MNSRPFFDQKPELLAPAGDLDRLKTAIRYGADAVYIGGRQFSLRSRASNFSLEDIREACAFANDHHAAVHVTVNMIPHDDDLDGLREYLIILQSYGVHAIIAASPYVMKTAKEVAPVMEVHCSTQMSVSNAAAAAFIAETFQADRIVLARECSMEDVKEICQASPVAVEAFIHGGMCVNYSGRCTLSNRMTLRDANRGGCAQSCRWQYDIFTGESEEPLPVRFTAGSKDLCAIRHIPSLMACGVSSFKIEGRMKTEYYIAGVVSAYRRLIDELYENGQLSQERMAYHESEILHSQNREVWGGFYDPSEIASSLILHDASDKDVSHDFIGRIVSVDDMHQTAVLEVRNVLHKGETVELLSPHHEPMAFKIDWIMNEKKEYMEIANHPMEQITIPVPVGTKEQDLIRRYGKL